MTSQIKLHGKEGKPPVSQTMKAGKLSMIYEDGKLRTICHGESEIIRMICFAVRDKDWLTIEPVITAQEISQDRNGAEISYHAHYRSNEIDFEADIKFSLIPGALVAEVTGIACSSFLKNRIGFCVLHPVSTCAGRECRITHPDGTVSSEVFPVDISPFQPFRNIRLMQWKLNETDIAALRFEGEVFETEDQRNWTDASYKTYSTPLDLPFPVEVKQGTALHQRIELSVELKSGARTRVDKHTSFRVSERVAGMVPDVGIGCSSRPRTMTADEAKNIRKIRFSHLRGEVFLFDRNFEKQYSVLANESIKTGFPLELCLLFGSHAKAEFRRFLNIYSKFPVAIKRIILLSQHDKTTTDFLISEVMPLINEAFPGIPAGAGTNCNFAQLNRSRIKSADIDFVSYSIHPQEHANDNLSLIENTAAQGYTVESCTKFEPFRPVCISPVTLKRRFNANTANFESPGFKNDNPLSTDPRQMSLFGAAWTVGSLKYLVESGAASVTYFETIGERGIYMGAYGSRWPLKFRAKKGMIFPVFHVFRMLLAVSGARVMQSTSSRPLLIDGFTVIKGTKGFIFLSNMTARNQKVSLQGIADYRVLFSMNTGNFDYITRHVLEQDRYDFPQYSAYAEPIRLKPYETRVLQFDAAQSHREQ